ncbi:MAG: DUF6273 domain-containing protein [Treponemataceae bacterium]|nr:DUF6273 domain-containing protein [Treponemataceae bacterium]
MRSKSLKISSFLSLIFLVSFILFSCAPLINFNKTADFTLSIIQPRSAISSSFDFASGDYTFSLTATNSAGTVSTIFENQPYSKLSESFSIQAGVYTFTLKAYLFETEAFSGSLNLNLQGSTNRLDFVMKVSEGFTSTASITLQLPSEGVSEVKAGIASIPFANIDECDISSAIELVIDNSTNPATVTYTETSLYTGKTQFAIFYLYDFNGALIATIPESIIIMPGRISSSTISNASYNLYSKVDYHLEIAGTPRTVHYAVDDEFDPAGITVYCKGSNGTSFEVPQGLYTTNFNSLVGCDKTVTFEWRGFTGDMPTKIHRASYRFTEEPRLSEHTSWAFPGTVEVPAVFYEFGDYPQSRKADEVDIPADRSRAPWCGWMIGEDGNYYEELNGNFFKVEPIIWRCLNTKVGSDENYKTINKAFLVAEHCLEAGINWFEYKDTSPDRRVDGNKVYSTNYEFSTIRAYLNGLNGANYDSRDYTGCGFLQKAFTNDARGLIYKTPVKNDWDSNSSNSGDIENRTNESYCGNNTNDKIFLLSAGEITNPDYGFNKKGNSDDEARYRYRTDYTDGRAYADDGMTHYWLRSQFYGSSWGITYKGDNVRYSKKGNIDNFDGVTQTNKGIVPACWVSLNGYVDTLKVSGTLNKQYYAAGEEFDPTGLTVTIYNQYGVGRTLNPEEYTTNFDELTGANQTLVISAEGLEDEAEQLIHKATYQFTEIPVEISGEETYAHTTDGDKEPTSSGTFYKFGDYPQKAKSKEVQISSGRAPWCNFFIGSDGNYYELNGSTYYQVEPIVWRALTVQGNKALLFSEYCLDSGIQFYWNDSVSSNAPYVRRYSGNETKTYSALDIIGAEQYHDFYAYGKGAMLYPNSYNHSTIRAYLNGIDASGYHKGEGDTSGFNFTGKGFLQKAFTSDARKLIYKDTVKNDITSGLIPLGSEWATTKQITRFSPNTQDKIFLLSLEEITNNDYGFAGGQFDDEWARKKYRTDYANSRGVYTKSGYAHYLIRTPKKDNDKQNFLYIKENGNPNNSDNVTKSDKGIVPACWVNLSESEVSDDSSITTDALLGDYHTPVTLASNTTRRLSHSYDLYNLISEGYNEGEYGPIIITKGYMMTSDKAGTFNIATDTHDEGVTELYVVTLSGTELVSGQSTGIWTDLQSGFGGSSDYCDNVAYIISGDASQYSKSASKIGTTGTGPLSVGLPAGSNLLVTGHSLGGMIAQQASDKDSVKNNYNVLNVVTFGSPKLNQSDSEYLLHRLCDRSDIVPYASSQILGTTSDAMWLDRDCENGGFGDEIYNTGELFDTMMNATSDTRDTTGPHVDSYRNEVVWAEYDVIGKIRGNKVIILDNSTKTFFKNPDLD